VHNSLEVNEYLVKANSRRPSRRPSHPYVKDKQVNPGRIYIYINIYIYIYIFVGEIHQRRRAALRTALCPCVKKNRRQLNATRTNRVCMNTTTIRFFSEPLSPIP